MHLYRQILLREGVLSPHSKVLANMASYSSIGSMSSLGGRESVASNMTSGEWKSLLLGKTDTDYMNVTNWIWS